MCTYKQQCKGWTGCIYVCGSTHTHTDTHIHVTTNVTIKEKEDMNWKESNARGMWYMGGFGGKKGKENRCNYTIISKN